MLRVFDGVCVVVDLVFAMTCSVVDGGIVGGVDAIGVVVGLVFGMFCFLIIAAAPFGT